MDHNICYWAEQCPDCAHGCEDRCAYFIPMETEMTDEEVQRIIEKGRMKYRNEWWRYVNQYDCEAK